MQSSGRDRQSGAIEARRVPSQRPVEVRYPLRRGYVIRSTQNISMTGMFVQTEDALPVGTTFAFRCRLEDERPFEGLAEVRWIRDATEGERRPAGMGIRFLELDDMSARTVRWLIERHLHDQQTPPGQFPPTTLPTDEAPSDAHDDPGGITASSPATQASPWGASADWREEIRQRRRRRRSARLVISLVLAVTIVALWLAAPRLMPLVSRLARPPVAAAVPGDSTEPAPTTPATVDGPREDTLTLQPIVPEPAVAPTIDGPIVPAVDSQTEVESFLGGWVAAWSDQRVDDYLDYYASSYDPGDLSRDEWEFERRTRISGPEFIRIRVTGISVLPLAGDEAGRSARATFVQSYRSDTYRDTVFKTLDLIREEDRWRIVNETSEPIEL